MPAVGVAYHCGAARVRRRRLLAGRPGDATRWGTTARACGSLARPRKLPTGSRGERRCSPRNGSTSPASWPCSSRAARTARRRSTRWSRRCRSTASAARSSRPPPSPRTTRWPRSRPLRIAEGLDVTGVFAVENVRARWTACSSTSWRCVRTTPGTGRSRAPGRASSSSTCARCSTCRSGTPGPPRTLPWPTCSGGNIAEIYSGYLHCMARDPGVIHVRQRTSALGDGGSRHDRWRPCWGSTRAGRPRGRLPARRHRWLRRLNRSSASSAAATRLSVMKEASDALDEFGIAMKRGGRPVGAPDAPGDALAYGESAAGRVEGDHRGAGGAAHLPGMLASVTPLPVIGCRCRSGPAGRARLVALDRADARRASRSRRCPSAVRATPGCWRCACWRPLTPARRSAWSSSSSSSATKARAKGEGRCAGGDQAAWGSAADRQSIAPESPGATLVSSGSEPGPLDGRAVVHHHVELRRRSPARRPRCRKFELEPHALRVDLDRLVGDRSGAGRVDESVDDVDGERDVSQARGVGLLAEDVCAGAGAPARCVCRASAGTARRRTPLGPDCPAAPPRPGLGGGQQPSMVAIVPLSTSMQTANNRHDPPDSAACSARYAHPRATLTSSGCP